MYINDKGSRLFKKRKHVDLLPIPPLNLIPNSIQRKWPFDSHMIYAKAVFHSKICLVAKTPK